MMHATYINSKSLINPCLTKKHWCKPNNQTAEQALDHSVQHIAALATTSINNTKTDTVTTKKNPNYSKIPCIKLYR